MTGQIELVIYYSHIMIVNATEFKAKCLNFMDLLEEKQNEIFITRHGKLIAKLIPITESKPISPIGFLKGKIKVNEDITKSLGVKWDFE